MCILKRAAMMLAAVSKNAFLKKIVYACPAEPSTLMFLVLVQVFQAHRGQDRDICADQIQPVFQVKALRIAAVIARRPSESMLILHTA